MEYLIQGYYSPYHDVKMFEDKEMEKKLQAMFEEIGFEGVFEVEFLIGKDGTFYFMETNFRASAWNPTCKFAGMPLPYLWLRVWRTAASILPTARSLSLLLQ